MTGGKTTIFEAIFHRIKFYDENMSILLFILISRDLYQKLMNTN